MSFGEGSDGKDGEAIVALGEPLRLERVEAAGNELEARPGEEELTPRERTRMGHGPLAPYPLLRTVTHYVSRRSGTVTVQRFVDGQPTMNVIPLNRYMRGAEFS